jgi:flagellar assembly protein FliH
MVILAREQALGYERWEMPEVGEPVPVLLKESEVMVAQPTLADIEAIERQAREEGFNAGLTEGRAMARRELVALTARLETLYEAAARPLATLDADVARELAWLSTVIAERVIGAELSLAPETILQVVQRAVQVLPAGERHVRVFLNPDDASLVREHRTAGEGDWTVVEDPQLSRGDCRLESENSRLDARLRTRLDSVIAAVLGDDVIDTDDMDADVLGVDLMGTGVMDNDSVEDEASA